MNAYNHDIYQAMAAERIGRYQAEAESHRRAKAARGQRAGGIDRLVMIMDQGLSVVRASLAADRRPRIPAI
jgi:hypothetical protein